MSKIQHEALAAAAQDALRAPSLFNTQPWRWRIDGHALELSADRDRQLAVTDPEGRLLLVSCGAVPHHARVALAAAGWHAEVRRLVETFSDRVLARLYLLERREATRQDRELHEAIARRRTDGRTLRRRSGAGRVALRLWSRRPRPKGCRCIASG